MAAFCVLGHMTNRQVKNASGPTVYVLWAGGSHLIGRHLFKIGYTKGSVDERACQIAAMSPLPIRIAATMPGGRLDEIRLHSALRRYRSHGEWFALPDGVALWMLEQFGVALEAAS